MSGIIRDESGVILGAAVWHENGKMGRSHRLTRLENHYQHQKLDLENNEIRVLVLDCTDTIGKLTGSLAHVPLEDPRPFDAISYAWDSPEIQRPIYLDSKKFYINLKLFQALRHLRSSASSKHIILWIDAICINQRNTSERNHQVSIMRHIYERAACVRIWLGLGNNQSAQAFAVARDLTQAVRFHREQDLFNDPQQISYFIAFQNLLHRRYWNRIWIIQEVNAATTAQVICGTDVIAWTDLLAAQNIVVANRDACWKLVRDVPSMAKFASEVFYEGPRGLVIQSSSQSPTLFDALRWHCTKVSTQPEDRIYGLLGITSARDDPRFILDYSRGTRQIYIDAAVYIIETTKNLDIICVMQSPLLNGTLVPRWVPDWLNGTPSWLLDSSVDIFDASMGSEAIVSFTTNGTTLTAKGFWVAEIVSTGPVLSVDNNDDDDDTKAISTMLTIFHECAQMLYLWNLNAATFSDPVAFVRTFACGRIMEELDLLAGLSQEHALRIMLGVIAESSRHMGVLSILGESLVGLVDEVKHPLAKMKAWARVILLDLRAIINRRRCIIASNNAIGMAYQLAEVGDKICILLGCSTPVILRPLEEDYSFIGDAYVDGYMFGKGIYEAEAEEHQWERFLIH